MPVPTQETTSEEKKDPEQISLLEEGKSAGKPARKASRKKNRVRKTETSDQKSKTVSAKQKSTETSAEEQSAGSKKETAEPKQNKSSLKADKEEQKAVIYNDTAIANLAQLTALSARGEHRQFSLGPTTEVRYGKKNDIHHGVMTLDWQGLGTPQFHIMQSGNHWYFYNVNFKNETWLNKKPVESKAPVELYNGDLIIIAKDSRILCLLFEDHFEADCEWRSCLLIKRNRPISFYSNEALSSIADIGAEPKEPADDMPHASFSWRLGRWHVEDHSVGKGIYVNGVKIEQTAAIDVYDSIRIGETYYVYMPGRLIYSLKGMIRKELIVSLQDRTVKVGFHREKVLLRDIKLTIQPGELVLLLGGSGAGKTTLINAITGYEPAHAKVLNGGVDVYENYGQMKYDIAVVPQQDLLRGTDDVYSTLYNAAQLRMPISYSKDEEKKRVEEVLNEFGLQAQKKSLVKSLSGGQRKRLSIACEFIGNPSLFILDEPDSGLDGVIARELIERLRRIADTGKIVIVITHTPDRVIDLFDHIIVLAKDSKKTGRLVYYGPIDEARKFFGKEKMEDIVKAINTKEEGGEGRADELIEKYQQQRQNGGNENA